MMTDFPTAMPVIARGKWFQGMTLIPGDPQRPARRLLYVTLGVAV